MLDCDTCMNQNKFNQKLKVKRCVANVRHICFRCSDQIQTFDCKIWWKWNRNLCVFCIEATNCVEYTALTLTTAEKKIWYFRAQQYWPRLLAIENNNGINLHLFQMNCKSMSHLVSKTYRTCIADIVYVLALTNFVGLIVFSAHTHTSAMCIFVCVSRRSHWLTRARNIFGGTREATICVYSCLYPHMTIFVCRTVHRTASVTKTTCQTIEMRNIRMALRSMNDQTDFSMRLNKQH